MAAWHTRLSQRMKTLGWNPPELARRSGVSKENIYKYLKGDVSQPRGNIVKNLADALGVSVFWLKEGLGPEFTQIPVVGHVSAGETAMIPFDEFPPGGGFDYLDFDLDAADPIAIEVRGASMMPVYRPGDFLLCSRLQGQEIERCIGTDCVIRTESGEAYIKLLARGSHSGTYTLESYNRAFPDIPDQQIRWAAPVLWVRRSDRRRTSVARMAV